MILESIAVTWDADNGINIAPMGPVVDGPNLGEFTLRPFDGSTTCRNLLETRRVVIHVTDDAGLFASAAIEKITDPNLVTEATFSDKSTGWRLRTCHRWFALEVTETTGGNPVYQMQTRIIDSGTEGSFFGFNRAKHAIIEAAILATRVNFLDHDTIRDDLDRCQTLVDKTASDQDAKTFDWLKANVHAKLVPPRSSSHSD